MLSCWSTLPAVSLAANVMHRPLKGAALREAIQHAVNVVPTSSPFVSNEKPERQVVALATGHGKTNADLMYVI